MQRRARDSVMDHRQTAIIIIFFCFIPLRRVCLGIELGDALHKSQVGTAGQQDGSIYS